MQCSDLYDLYPGEEYRTTHAGRIVGQNSRGCAFREGFCRFRHTQLMSVVWLPHHPSLKPSVDDAVQTMVKIYFPRRLWYLTHYPNLGNQPNERAMFDTTRHDVYWPPVSSEVYVKVSNCVDWARIHAWLKRKWPLKRPPANGELELNALDFLGPFLKTKTRSQFKIDIRDR